MTPSIANGKKFSNDELQEKRGKGEVQYLELRGERK